MAAAVKPKGNVCWEAPPAKRFNLDYRPTPAVLAAAKVLEFSPLVLQGHSHWRALNDKNGRPSPKSIGFRVFNSLTVNCLISYGIAVREGDYVRLNTGDSLGRVRTG